MDSNDEKSLKDCPSPIFIEGTKTILKQMEKSICKICIKDGTKGTGFFCKIPLSDKNFLSTIVTNNHVINEKYLNKEKEIIIKMNDGNKTEIKTINIKNKFYYTNKDYDITIIQIESKKDNSYEFLELDDNILNDNGLGYVGNSIYLLHYPSHFEEDKVAVSYGILKGRFEDKTYNFMHYCSTEYGSSGSPILNISNNKVIGIHKQKGTNNYNVGAFLYDAIKNLIMKFNNKLGKKMTDKMKKIIQLFSSYYDIKNEFTDFLKNLCEKNLISDIIQIKRGKEEIDGLQLICSQEFLPKNYSSIYKDWIPAWHGTNYKNLENIIKYGFKLPGTKLEDGSITPKAKYIPKTEKVSGIKNWEKAIFASPNVYGASEYSDQSIDEFKCLVEVRIKPNSFTEHNIKTVVDHLEGHGISEDVVVNYKFYRISSEKNIILKSIVFLRYIIFILPFCYRKTDEQKMELKKCGFID